MEIEEGAGRVGGVRGSEGGKRAEDEDIFSRRNE